MDEPILGFFHEYHFLSNFYILDNHEKIAYKGLHCTHSEGLYQAMKTLEPDAQELIVSLDPKMSKKTGRSCKMRKDWESIKDRIMAEIVHEKFKNPYLRQRLLDTGDSYLEETNTWHDKYWGVCNRVGKNKLGLILMHERSKIREEQHEQS